MRKILTAARDISTLAPIVFIDIGARWGGQRPWNNFPGDCLVYYGFDADAEECNRLNSANKNASVKYLPAALSDGEAVADLHLTVEEGCSSLYEPNYKVLDRYFLKENWRVKKKIKLQTTTLSNIFREHSIKPDFIKIDTQGAELNILRGAADFLDSALGLELEVEFQEMYVGQPLFSDVDSFVRGKGFELFDLNRYWANNSALKKDALNRGQIVFGDAVYFRSRDSFYALEMSPEQRKEKLLKMVLIFSLYGFFDSAADYISHKSSPFSVDERAVLVKALSKASEFPAWQRFLFNNKLATKFGRLLKLIGNQLSFPLNTTGWGTDYNGVDGRYPYFRKF